MITFTDAAPISYDHPFLDVSALGSSFNWNPQAAHIPRVNQRFDNPSNIRISPLSSSSTPLQTTSVIDTDSS